MTQIVAKKQEEWLKVLGKGMVTLPKKWRDELGLDSGDIVKAKKQGNIVTIEIKAQNKPSAPYRVFSDAEINEFLEEDTVPKNVQIKAKNILAS